MNKLTKPIESAKEFLSYHRKMANWFLGLTLMFSLLLASAGLYFLNYVQGLLNSIQEISNNFSGITLDSKESSLATPQQLASIVGENTMWLPLFAGMIIGLLAVTYLFRIHTIRKIKLEEELLKMESYNSLINEKTTEDGNVVTSLLHYLSQTKVSDNPQIYPALELTEKSIEKLSSAIKKSGEIISRPDRNA